MDFIKRFGEFERKLRKFADAPGASSGSNLLARICAKSPVVAKRSDLIKDIFSLRNVFSHQNQGSRYIAEVNKLAFEVMDEVESKLEEPPQVGEFFKRKVYFVEPDFLTDEVIRTMRAKIYTHVPIYDREWKFKGVLSETTIFNWLAEAMHQGNADFRKKQIKDINPRYLYRKNDGFEFVSAAESIFNILDLFQVSLVKNKRLGVVFVTAKGDRDEEPIGVITAHDLPKIQSRL